jgi:glutamate dehydrogenase
MFEIWVYSPRVGRAPAWAWCRAAVALVGPTRGFPHRDPRADEGAERQNTLIVPVGARGGFVPKQLPRGSRDEIQKEGIECYRVHTRPARYHGQLCRQQARTAGEYGASRR